MSAYAFGTLDGKYLEILAGFEGRVYLLSASPTEKIILTSKEAEELAIALQYYAKQVCNE